MRRKISETHVYLVIVFYGLEPIKPNQADQERWVLRHMGGCCTSALSLDSGPVSGRNYLEFEWMVPLKRDCSPEKVKKKAETFLILDASSRLRDLFPNNRFALVFFFFSGVVSR